MQINLSFADAFYQMDIIKHIRIIKTVNVKIINIVSIQLVNQRSSPFSPGPGPSSFPASCRPPVLLSIFAISPIVLFNCS